MDQDDTWSYVYEVMSVVDIISDATKTEDMRSILKELSCELQNHLEEIQSLKAGIRKIEKLAGKALACDRTPQV